jgi:putative ABC transport system ATP-binding protein
MDQNIEKSKLIELIKDNFNGDLNGFLQVVTENKTLIEERLQSEAHSKIVNLVDYDENEVLIKIRDLKKTYKVGNTTIEALKGADLNINKGEIVAIVGPSGSGKSTLLQLIGGLDKPTSGSIVVDNQELSMKNDYELSDYRNKTIGFIFQSFYLQPYLNVEKNVELPMMFRKMDRSLRKQSAVSAVDAVGLSNRIDHLPKQLSGGQMQRVAIARAIVNNCKIILADEPTANLDKETTLEVLNLLQKVRDDLGTSIVIVTHNELVAKSADRIIKIDDGKIL